MMLPMRHFALSIIKPLVTLSGLVGVLILFSACNPSAAPDTDGPILTGGQALPKSLATIYLSATPNLPQTAASSTAAPPSNTPLPPTITPTETPYIGQFIGAQTPPAVGGTFTWQPTRTARLIIFTPIPGFHPTVVPIVFNGAPPGNGFSPGVGQPPISFTLPPPGTPHPCTIPVAAQFNNAYSHSTAASARLGCPLAAGYSLHLVTESFQTGVMFWRETKEIYALSTLNLSKGATQDAFWRVPDSWTDGLPASDPTLKPPAGTSQPVRGFGYAWRNNPQIRVGLGWALGSEQSYNGFWQDFEHGVMLTGNNNTVYALVPLDGPPTTNGVQFGALPQ